jgi:hypothetical protein
MKVPCKYSNPDNGLATKCSTKTCDYCIGNTYEYDQTSSDYGTPKCIGATNSVTPTPASISYSPETILTDEQRSTYLTVQSPLITVDNIYSIKYAPTAINDSMIDVEIPQNKCVIYDTKNSASTIKYSTALFSAGRSDIIYIKDTSPFLDGMTDKQRYIILGEYGVSDLMYDMMPFTGLALPVDAFPVGVACYADDNGK